MSFLDLLKIEFMKVKRSKIVPLIFIAPLLVVSSGIANLSSYFTPEYTNAWSAMFIQSALENIGVDTRVMTAIEMKAVAEPYIRRRAERHLEKGRVVIFAGGTGSPYFSTDTTSALRAAEINADVILMAKNGVDGVYNADPKLVADAIKFEHLTHMDVITKGLQVMDSTASTMSMDNHIPLVVFNMNEAGNITRVVRGEEIGTTVE